MKIDLSKLKEAVRIMGAEGEDPGAPIDWGIREPKTGALTPEDLQDIQEVDGKLTLHGERVAIYIPEELVSTGLKKISPWKRELPTIDELKSGKVKPQHKVHVTNCRTIREMRKAGRVEGEYAVYAKVINPDGWFKTYPRNMKKRTGEELLLLYEPCINCLKKRNWKGCRDNSERARQLAKEIGSDSERAREFFAAFSFDTSEAPPHTAEAVPENSYPDNWSAISRRKREEVNWTCEQCGLDCRDNPGFLDVHHEGGHKGNSSSENLIALCGNCHVEQPFHGHMKHADGI